MTNQHNTSLLSFIAITLLVSTLYAVTGNLGLGFASGSQYSTAIRIPSGIALGAVLVFGLRALPAVFLGSLFINYQLTAHSGASIYGIEPLIVGSLIASGAALRHSLAGC